jgi:uncharacterized protein
MEKGTRTGQMLSGGRENFMVYDGDLMLFTALLPLLLVLLVAGFARGRWKAATKEFGNRPLRRNLTGAEAVGLLWDKAGLKGAEVVEYNKFYTNRFDAKTKRLLLSSGVFRGKNKAAIGLALHEAGHALQVQEKEELYLNRMAAIRSARFFPGALLLLVIPAVFRLLPLKMVVLGIGAGWFLLCLWHVATLPAESDANKRVLPLLRPSGIASNVDEEDDLRSVMAASTWIRLGDFLSAVFQLFLSPLACERQMTSHA